MYRSDSAPPRFVLTLLISVILLAHGCASRPLDERPDSGAGSQTNLSSVVLTDKVDLLFVIDNSAGLQHEQRNLSKNFPRLIDALRSSKLGGKIPNLHIGVISTDLGAGDYNLPSCEVAGGDQGKMQNKPQIAGCKAPRDLWISYNEGKVNIPGASGDPVKSVKAAFQCIAQIGEQGCGFEMPLESARRALEPAGKVNPGFLRLDALFALHILMDEDDCSARDSKLFDPSQQGLSDPLGPLTSFRCFEFGIRCDCPGKSKCDRATQGPRKNCVPAGNWLYPIDEYVSFYRKLKPTGGVVMAAIAGPTERVEVGVDGSNPTLKPGCQTAQGFATPSIRIKALMHEFARELSPQEVADIKAKKKNIPHFVDNNGAWREENIFTVCAADYSPGLKHFGERILHVIGHHPLCLPAPLITHNGALVCRKGDTLGSGDSRQTCKASCLEKAECVVESFSMKDIKLSHPVPVPRCTGSRFSDPKILDCGSTCPCWRVTPRAECGLANYGLEILNRTKSGHGPARLVRARCRVDNVLGEISAGRPQCR